MNRFKISVCSVLNFATMIFHHRSNQFTVICSITLLYIKLITGLDVGFEWGSKRNIMEISDILKNMDQSVDPCTDFYSFACGGFMKHSKSNGSLQRDIYNDRVRMIIKILSSKINIPSDISTARNMFSNCKRLSGPSENRQTVIQEIVDEMKIGWLSKSIRNESFDETIDLVETAHKFRKMGFNFRLLLGVYVTPRSDDDRRNILEIRRPFLSQDFANKDTIVLVSETSEQLNIVEAGSFFDYMNDYFPLQKFIEGLLPEGNTFSRDDEIRVDANYITALIEFLNTTSKEHLAEFLTEKILEEFDVLLPPSVKPNDVRNCFFITAIKDHNFQVAASKYFIPDDYAFYARNLLKHLERTLIKIVDNSKYISNKSKEVIHVRMKQWQKLVLYTNNTITHPALDWTDVDHKKFAKNILALSKSQMDNKFLQLNTSVDVREWDFPDSPILGFPKYFLWSKSIYYPALFVSSVLYDLNLPNSLNYGGMGYVMGHELSHALNFARNFKNSRMFDVKEECLANAFKKYYSNETLIETFADLVGYKVAYQSYIDDFQKNQGEDDVLPGTKYTSRQLFWLSGANLHCSKITKRQKDDGHGPGNIRVLITYSNAPEFAKDFNCTVGSAMNPKNKCDVL